jgi:hypothetical protein
MTMQTPFKTSRSLIVSMFRKGRRISDQSTRIQSNTLRQATIRAHHSGFSNELFSIYQWSNERGRCGQQGQDASVDQFLGEAFGEWLIELKQKLCVRLIDSPISQLRYRFTDGVFIQLIFDQINLDVLLLSVCSIKRNDV